MKGHGHRNWANAHHKALMQQRNKRRWGPKGDPIVLLLSVALVIAVGLAVFFWPTASISSDTPSGRASGFSCRVMSITDGDTLRCWNGQRVRLHAVAARESDETCSPGHPCPSASGAAATAKLSELASGQTLQCQPTGTSYNRVTAICRNEANVEINCAMVQSGTALIWPKFNNQRPICR